MTGHTGRPNNGLLAVWPGANFQGALDMGFSPEATERLLDVLDKLKVLFIADADPAGEDLAAAEALKAFKAKGGFLVVTSLFANATTALADVVLPRLSFAERDGTFTNGERRVQRFYRAIEARVDGRAEWQAFQQLMQKLEYGRARLAAAAVMADITKAVPHYAEMSYTNLAKVAPQFPKVGGDDLYYGGTSYKNEGGLGIQWAAAADAEDYRARLAAPKPQKKPKLKKGELLIVPVRLFYDRGVRFGKTEMTQHRVPAAYVMLNDADAERLDIASDDRVRVAVNGAAAEVVARVAGDAIVPAGAALLPLDLDGGAARRMLTAAPSAGTVSKVTVSEAVEEA
jgi:NADH-quinone oxidoreductase subunit G